ncbi:swi2 snf2-containing protein [Cyclospora cayetanensis]|nr:swi2 snf2-containing protein [Cyclospora cayetanensis]
MGALRPVYVELFVLRDSVEESILARRAEWSSQDFASDDADEEKHTASASALSVGGSSSAFSSGTRSPSGPSKGTRGPRRPREGCGTTGDYLRSSRSKLESVHNTVDASVEAGERAPQRHGVELLLPASCCPWACEDSFVKITLMPQPSWERLLAECRGSRDVLQQSTETLLRTLKFVP